MGQPAPLHNLLCMMQSWGATLSQAHMPSAATKAYTNMLLDVALNQVSVKSASTFTVSQVALVQLHDRSLGHGQLLQELPCILAAMIPCTRLYAYIGCQLRAAALAAPTVIRARGPYASWIKEYSSDDFLALPALKEALLDKLGTAVPYGKHCPFIKTGLAGTVPWKRKLIRVTLLHLPVKLPWFCLWESQVACAYAGFCHNGRALLRRAAALC